MKIELDLVPFNVPAHVYFKRPSRPRDEGISFDQATFKLSELSETALASLCDKFREDVFTEAKKKDPARKEETDGR